MTLHRCERCGEPREILGDTGRALVCATCWKALGRPCPDPAGMTAVHAAEVATRERMNARGGADRHLVRKGLT